MKQINKTGIWMDHSIAHLTRYSFNSLSTSTIESLANSTNPELSEITSENNIQKKEQYQDSEYFKRIIGAIKEVDEILLFGPTDAKTELFNLLKEDHHFDNKSIEVVNADKMTEKQEHAFVRKYFTTAI